MLTIKTIKGQKGEINNIDEWECKAKPQKTEHWQDKHSAKEFARFILGIKNGKSEQIKNANAFEEIIGECTKCTDFDFYAEYQTELVMGKYNYGKRGPRHHDGLMVGDDIIIGIEAKATESLDSFLGDKPIYDDIPSHIKRYHNMTKMIVGKDPLECEYIRYQLISGTAGTIIEAAKRGFKKALFLVITLKTPKVTNQMIARNEKDINEFLKLLKKNDDDSYTTSLSEELGVKLYIKHLIVECK